VHARQAALALQQQPGKQTCGICNACSPTPAYLYFFRQTQSAALAVLSQHIHQHKREGGWKAQQHAVLEEQQCAQQRHHSPLPHSLQQQ
jgi:hypothetical protein